MKNKRKSTGNSGGGRRISSDSYMVDPLIVPRVEQFSLNNDIQNVEVVSEYLMRNYREYQRRQQGVFRKLVARAIQIVLRKQANENAEERRLQQQESEHLKRKAGELNGPQFSGTDSDSDSDTSPSHSSPDFDPENPATTSPRKRRRGAGQKGRAGEDEEEEEGEENERIEIQGLLPEDSSPNLLNASLRLTYDSKRPSLVLNPAKTPQPSNSASSLPGKPRASPAMSLNPRPSEDEEDKGSGSSGEGGGFSVPEPQRSPFASPQTVAAAAARFLQKQKQKPGDTSVVANGDLPCNKSPARNVRDNAEEEGPSSTNPVLNPGPEAGTAPGSPGFRDATPSKPISKTPKRATSRAAPRAQQGSGPGEAPGFRDSAVCVPRAVGFRDFGGLGPTLQLIRELVQWPLCHPEVYRWLGVAPPRGVLLHGPPGCGKTMLAHAIASEARVPFLKVAAPELVSGMSGESEAKIRALFQEASSLSPCIVFIDEIDAVAPKRETAQREMERRMVAQLLACMDDLSAAHGHADGAENHSEGGQNRPMRRGHVVVIGATNRPDSLDPALRRAGRFDREISLGIPDEDGRARILEVLAQKLRLEGAFDFKSVARKTPGFVGADLQALTKEAAAIAVKRIFASLNPSSSSSSLPPLPLPPLPALPSVLPPPQRDPIGVNGGEEGEGREGGGGGGEEVGEDVNGAEVEASKKEGDAMDVEVGPVAVNGTESGELNGTGAKEWELMEDERWKTAWGPQELEALRITMDDFEAAIPCVQPSSKREGFATIPDVQWDDVGALEEVREELEFSISRPIKCPEEYQAMGLDMAVGVLLYGPPGCGKTLVAKAVAADAGANFISIKGPELLNKFVGESERAVRQLFSRARASAPCVLFFDEMDAMAPKRGSDGNQAAERVVNQLLTEMDGLDSRKSIFLIAATNRPDMMDPALLRPGRLDKLLYVPLPTPAGRASIMGTLIRNKPMGSSVDPQGIARSNRCRGFSGADLASLVREACIAALRERILLHVPADKSPGPPIVEFRHFESALERVQPSVSEKDVKRYDNLRMKLRSSRLLTGKRGPELSQPEREEDEVDNESSHVPA